MKHLHTITAALLLTVSLAVGCSEAPPAQPSVSASAAAPNQAVANSADQLLVSDTKNLGYLDIATGKMQIVRNKVFLQSIQFDQQTGDVLAPGYARNPAFVGLITLNGTDKKEVSIKDQGFGPIRLYQHEKTLLMNSAQVQKVGDADATELAFFNRDTGKLDNKQKVKGIVQSIAGEGSTAYLAAQHFAGKDSSTPVKHSNIYAVDMNSKSLRPIFSEDQAFVPLELGVKNGQLYGVYETYPNGAVSSPQDQFVLLDPATGETKKKVDLNPYARDLSFSADGKYAFIAHNYAMFNPEAKVKAPITRINLETFAVDTLEGDFRAANMVEWNHKLYVGDELKKQITVIDGNTLQIEKTIPLEIPPIYLASKTESGNQHIQ